MSNHIFMPRMSTFVVIVQSQKIEMHVGSCLVSIGFYQRGSGFGLRFFCGTVLGGLRSVRRHYFLSVGLLVACRCIK